MGMLRAEGILMCVASQLNPSDRQEISVLIPVEFDRYSDSRERLERFPANSYSFEPIHIQRFTIALHTLQRFDRLDDCQHFHRSKSVEGHSDEGRS